MKPSSSVQILLLAALPMIACGKEKNDRASADSASAVPVAALSQQPPKDTVPGAGRLHWTLTDLEKALQHEGLHPVRKGTVRQPFMGPEGTRFRIDGGELQAYLYGDAVALGRDTDKLDTTSVAPPNTKINWAMPPSLITENNLAVILLTRDPQLRERVKTMINENATAHGP